MTTAIEYAIRDACDGDRQPNAARELLTLEVCIWAYKEITEWVNRWDETAANPHMQ